MQNPNPKLELTWIGKENRPKLEPRVLLEVGPDRTLLVLSTAFRGKTDRYPNLTVKKIPKQVLSRCEWGHDDYSLQVENLPKALPKPNFSATDDSPRAAWSFVRLAAWLSACGPFLDTLPHTVPGGFKRSPRLLRDRVDQELLVCRGIGATNQQHAV